jgi:hypothetical protein
MRSTQLADTKSSICRYGEIDGIMFLKSVHHLLFKKEYKFSEQDRIGSGYILVQSVWGVSDGRSGTGMSFSKYLSIQLSEFFHHSSIPIFTLNILFTRRTSGRSLETFTQSYCLGYRQSIGHKSNIMLLLDFKAHSASLRAFVMVFIYNLIIYLCKRLFCVVKHMVLFQRPAHLTSLSASLVRYSNKQRNWSQ